MTEEIVCCKNCVLNNKQTNFCDYWAVQFRRDHDFLTHSCEEYIKKGVDKDGDNKPR